MADAELQQTIDKAWDDRDSFSPATGGPVRDAVEMALSLLDQGKLRVAEKKDGRWTVNQWLKKAVLLSFRFNENRIMGPAIGVPVSGPTSPGPWWDKVPTKF